MTPSAQTNGKTLDFLLNERECPVARMRLFSHGINQNNRFFLPDEVTGDKGCTACGNCVDACPVVKEKYRFVFLQNQRTSMALENMVGVECRRCFKCIVSCPQVSKPVKEYGLSFRRGEKIVHLLTAIFIVLLAISGITSSHYGIFLPTAETSILKYAHRLLGALLLFMPLLYFILDKKHMLRFLRKVFVWDRGDLVWLQGLWRHLKNSKEEPLPYRGEFNPFQKAWYIYIICILLPVLGLTGIIQWVGLSYGHSNASLVVWCGLIHMIVAFTTDLLLLAHVYLKYLRNWAILAFDVIKTYISERHLRYSVLYKS
jgi:cytochrome b subunit of formate dehydrogenase